MIIFLLLEYIVIIYILNTKKYFEMLLNIKPKVLLIFI